MAEKKKDAPTKEETEEALKNLADAGKWTAKAIGLVILIMLLLAASFFLGGGRSEDTFKWFFGFIILGITIKVLFSRS